MNFSFLGSRLGRAVLAFVLSILPAWIIAFAISMMLGIGQEVGSACEGTYIFRCSAKAALPLAIIVALFVGVFTRPKR